MNGDVVVGTAAPRSKKVTGWGWSSACDSRDKAPAPRSDPECRRSGCRKQINQDSFSSAARCRDSGTWTCITHFYIFKSPARGLYFASFHVHSNHNVEFVRNKTQLATPRWRLLPYVSSSRARSKRKRKRKREDTHEGKSRAQQGFYLCATETTGRKCKRSSAILKVTMGGRKRKISCRFGHDERARPSTSSENQSMCKSNGALNGKIENRQKCRLPKTAPTVRLW